MSCVQCDLHKNGFQTENEFTDFEDLLGQLVRSAQFERLGRKSEARFFEVRYKCNNCNAIWILSIPDQAYRGGWHEE